MEKTNHNALLAHYDDAEKEIFAYQELLKPEDPLHQYLRMVTQEPKLSLLEEQALIADGSEEAKEKLALANLRYAVIAALWCKGCDIPVIDLIQEANAAIVKAVQTYRPESQTRFSLHVIRTIQRTLSQVVHVQKQRQIVQRRAQMHESPAKTFSFPGRDRCVLSEDSLRKIGPVQIGEVVFVNWNDRLITADFRSAHTVWEQPVQIMPAEVMEMISLPGLDENVIRKIPEEVLVVTDADLLGASMLAQQWVADVIKANLSHKGFVLAGVAGSTELSSLREALGPCVKVVDLE